jgi:hypothetical protein
MKELIKTVVPGYRKSEADLFLKINSSKGESGATGSGETESQWKRQE